VLIGSDGSTDGTDALVLGNTDARVRLSAAPRGGKTSVLNRCIPLAQGDIVLLSDANTVIDSAAVKRIVRHFEDPSVGVVCGQLRLYNPTNAQFEESTYWTYESLLKFYEGKRGAVMGANGGLYAIRRSLFEALPPSTIVDDFVIPMRILEKDYKVIYEPEALAHEETTEDYDKEFGRRARIAAGNFQSLRLVPGLLSPLAGFPAFAFWSHKVLRWCAPALMALALVANLFLLHSLFYQVLLAGQVVFYTLAYLGKRGALRGSAHRVASVAYYFVTMNWAIAVGFWRFLRNTQRAAWDRTARTAS
jgi:cellulose synthase/poly-beta-1,6-N-acetylglucosamine synthase-like glycosyltransferase